MPNHSQQPQIQKTPSGLEETHPAYGVVHVSRRQCHPGMNLFGSDLAHQHYITVSVRRASVQRDLHRDWVFPREELVEFSMSEAQWARFVAGSNQSFASEVTLERYGEGGRYFLTPEIDKGSETRKDQFDREFNEKLQRKLEGLQNSIAELKELSEGKSVSKVKLKDILSSLTIQMENLPKDLNFAVGQFKEVTEKTVEEAKVEIEAYVSAAINRAGLESTSIHVPHLPSNTETDTTDLAE